MVESMRAGAAAVDGLKDQIRALQETTYL